MPMCYMKRYIWCVSRPVKEAVHSIKPLAFDYPVKEALAFGSSQYDMSTTPPCSQYLFHRGDPSNPSDPSDYRPQSVTNLYYWKQAVGKSFWAEIERWQGEF